MKESSGCKLPDRCGAGPLARSFFGGGGGYYNHHPGPIFNEHYVHKQSHGKVIPYTGFEVCILTYITLH